MFNVFGRKFNFRASLSPHLRSHGGEKPSACSLCGKKILQKKSLRVICEFTVKKSSLSVPFVAKYSVIVQLVIIT